MGGKRPQNGLEEAGQQLRGKVGKGTRVTAQHLSWPFAGGDNKIHLNAKKIQNWANS